MGATYQAATQERGCTLLTPIIVSSVVVLAWIILCLIKPNLGRILFGLFFLVMAIGVNGTVTLTNPHSYIEYAQGAPIPLYRELALSIVRLNPMLFGFLLISFEIVMALLILHKRKSVRIGLIGTMMFLVGIAPLSILQIPWLGLIIGEAYLLTKEFDTSFLDTVWSKLHPRRL